MKKNETKQERPQALKRKLMSALAMLLVSTILLTTTSYAWFVLSTAPEVTGIETQVGANGSLEIALLNTETRADMSKIRAGLGGGSLQENQITANNAWGNLIDLGYASYGLGELVLMPARLDTSDGISVDLNKLLAVPTYGYDGRIIELTSDTASAIYQETGFLYSGAQDYGVRAIGTSDALSPQGSALASAKTNISTYTKGAQKDAQSSLADNTEGLIGIIVQKSTGGSFDDTHKETLSSMISALDSALNYIDLSLRQGLVAYAASEIGDEDTFALVRDRIMNTGTALSDLMNDLGELGTVPEEFADWVAKLTVMQNDLATAKVNRDELNDGDYTWDEIKNVMATTMNMDKILINGDTINNFNMTQIPSKIEMQLVSGSGLFADIADFVGNYSHATQYMGMEVELMTVSAEKPAHLVGLQTAVNTLTPADGGDAAAALPLTATYGYAIDLAFRCNAAMPDLVLQTKGVQRIYNGGENPDDLESDNGSTQGGGSYMEFTSLDEDFTLEQRLALMESIRVGFIDDTGAILAIAKLNVMGRESENGVVKAPLYLYDYSFEQDDTGLVMNIGERRLTDNLITPLEQNVAKAVTVVVWLDGDIVDNTMVSATQATSLNGVLNLQFATSAELVPAVDGNILKYALDKSGLEEAILVAAEIVNAGQGSYTNVSWNALVNAYNRAVAVNDNDNASDYEIRSAVTKLAEAATMLMEVSHGAISEKVTQLQEIVNAGNVVDEGNGVQTTIYTDDSWNNLSAALNDAAAVAGNDQATEDEINNALTALENAEKGLTRQVFFIPYEYNGDLFYMAIREKDAEDTYGRWYDSQFNRIFSEATMLKLDAYAEPVEIAQMGQNAWVASDADKITPDVKFLEEVFPELRDVEVLGAHWSEADAEYFTELMSETHYSDMRNLISMVDSDPVLTQNLSAECTAARNAAEALTAKWENNEEVLAATAEAALDALMDAVITQYNTNVTSDTDLMTANQRILLQAVANTAKAHGVDSINLTEVDEMYAEDVSAKQANEYIVSLHEDLKTAGVAYSTLSYGLPEGFGNGSVIYNVDYPGISLKVNGKSGHTVLNATVLTKDGVVINVSQNITIYDRAEGVKLFRNATEITSLELTAGSSADILADLIYTAAEYVPEEIKGYTWASSDTAVVTVSGDQTGTVAAVGAGDATVSLSIQTVAGNAYTIELPVSVS